MAAYIIRHLFLLGNLGICVSPLAIFSIGLYFTITPDPSKLYPLFGVPVLPRHGRHHTIAHKSHIIGARAHTISTPTIPYHQIVLHYIPTPPAFLTQPQPISSNTNAIFIVNDNQDPSIRVLCVWRSRRYVFGFGHALNLEGFIAPKIKNALLFIHTNMIKNNKQYDTFFLRRIWEGRALFGYGIFFYTQFYFLWRFFFSSFDSLKNVLLDITANKKNEKKKKLKKKNGRCIGLSWRNRA